MSQHIWCSQLHLQASLYHPVHKIIGIPIQRTEDSNIQKFKNTEITETTVSVLLGVINRCQVSSVCRV